MRNTQYFIAALLVMMVSVMHGQTFEGVVTLQINSRPDYVTVMTIKDDKTLTEVRIDSAQTIKIIKDVGAETTTILRSKNEMKYGFRSHALYGDYEYFPTTNPDSSQVEVVVTRVEKYFGQYKCVKVTLQSPKAAAEAWIAEKPGMHLTDWFPSFLGEGTDPNLYLLRELADRKGLVMYYRELLKADMVENIIEVTVDEKEIAIDAFAIDPAYFVFDENSMKQLMIQAQSDPLKKQQLEEFQQIFGNK